MVAVFPRLVIFLTPPTRHLYLSKFTWTVSERLISPFGKYQKMKGMMKCGNIYDMFWTMRMYSYSEEVTVNLLVPIEQIISSLQ